MDFAPSQRACGGRRAARRPPRRTTCAGEYRIQSRLRPVYRYVPEMVALCTDPAVIGSDFYAMERVPGTILRSELPAGVTPTEGRAGFQHYGYAVGFLRDQALRAMAG